MPITRNRELSQFGSFIYIDDSTQNIGITSGSTPFVGIGTTIPSVKFEVVGDTNIFGTLEATSYTLNGLPLTNADIKYWNFAENNTDIYRVEGNVGVGTSVFTEKLTVLGNVSAGQFISTVLSGTAPFVVLSDTQVTNLNASFLRSRTSPIGDIVGTTDIQTLTNKTLTSPIISSILNTGIITLPTLTTTLVGRNTTDILTNKTIVANSNTITGLTNANLSGSAGISNANLANSTISGVALGGNLESLSFGSYINVGGSYNGSTARSVSIAGTSINIANTLVARNNSGDFTSGSINCSNLTASFTITAQDINSTSDIKLKTNIKDIDNSLKIINNLRGVSFDWKETKKVLTA
jgi:hypothetical protein